MTISEKPKLVPKGFNPSRSHVLESLNFLTALEAIRKRPGMYVGSSDQAGLHHMLFSIFDDLLMNARGGRGSGVLVQVNEDGSCLVADEGRWSSDGLPLKDSVYRLTTELFAGNNDRGVVPTVQIRNYLPVVRALSTHMEVFIREKTRSDVWRVVTYKGIEGEGEWRDGDAGIKGSQWRFALRFWPDPEIFGDAKFCTEIIRRRLCEMVALCPELYVEYGCESEQITMHDGMADLLAYVLGDVGVTSVLRHPERPFRLQVQYEELSFDIAIQWHWGHECKEIATIASWANDLRTNGGSHEVAVKEVLRASGLDEVPYAVAVSVYAPRPKFSSARRDRLNCPEIRRFLRDHLAPALNRLIDDDLFAVEFDWMKTRRAELASLGHKIK